MIASYSLIRSAMVSSSQRACRSCKAARSTFGSEAYAASRMRSCRKRHRSSTGPVSSSARNTSFSTSTRSCRGRSALAEIGEQLGHRGPIEGATDDGRPLCDDPFWRFELIES